ncbi:MAG: hypothetical protein R6X14_02170 [bacterium]
MSPRLVAPLQYAGRTPHPRRLQTRLGELAHLMGREPGFYAHLSRLEHGRAITGPTG